MSSFAPSVVGAVSDLDGFSIAGDSYYPLAASAGFPDDDEEFGFDPPNRSATFLLKMDQTYSPREDHESFGDFAFDPTKTTSDHISPVRAIELDRMIAQTIPNATTAVSRYGQVTPPRSNSESSMEKLAESKSTKQRRPTKSLVKEELSQPVQTGRKRRNTRKNSTTTTGIPEEDDKRRQSLEKNRLAAAKCRVNKKEKTEQLQRDSHDKAVQNAFLKEQVMRMKEEVQQINALLLAHANCEGCKSPEDIQKHLSNLGNGFLSSHMSAMAHEFQGFANIPLDMSEMDHEHYFSPTSDHNMMNPPLPDFDREPEFHVSTPMHTD